MGLTLYIRNSKTFLRKNGIKHHTSASYHPASNGLERVMQIFKSNMSKLSEGSIEDKLSHRLFYNHITPQTTTGLSPAELLQGRCLRSRLDLIKPDLNRTIEGKKCLQKTLL